MKILYQYNKKFLIYTNKRPMGHIAHLRKQFKSNNTYDYIITWIRRRKIPLSSFLELHGSLFFLKNFIPLHLRGFVQSLVETVPVVLEKIFKFCQCIFVTSYLSPLGKWHDPSFEQTYISSFKDALCQVWLKLAWF